jgi:hypothetical protein
VSQNLPVKITCSFSIEVGADGSPVVTIDGKHGNQEKLTDISLTPPDVITLTSSASVTGLSATLSGGITPYCAEVSGLLVHLTCGRIYKGSPDKQSGSNTWTLTFGGAANPLISGLYTLIISTKSGAQQTFGVTVASNYYSCP